MAKEVGYHVERGTWDLSRVRELSEWMRDDAYSEVLVGRLFVTLGVKFAELAKSERKIPSTCSISGEQHMVEIRPVSLRDFRRGLELSILVDGSSDGDGSWHDAGNESFLQGRFERVLAGLD